MNEGFRVIPLHFLAPEAQETAALLYWQAFSDKLSHLLGPEVRALALIRDGMDPRHALAAVNHEGRLVGVAGFRSAQGSFVSLSPRPLRRHYGRLGAAWRLAALRLLGSDTDNARFLVDGLCVAPDQRGQGIGSLLLAGLADLGQTYGYRAMRLDVTSANTRAQALYLRRGFQVVGRQNYPLAWPVFGVRACLVMECPLPVPQII